ncbi:MAG: SWIM zinc finger family protein [Candidatus Caldarchaeum sp.]
MPVTWTVPSQSNPSVKYTVVFDGERFSCSCPDFMYRGRECKHVYAVKLSEGLLKADIQPVKPAKQYVEHPLVREGVVRG